MDEEVVVSGESELRAEREVSSLAAHWQDEEGPLGLGLHLNE